MSGQIGDVKKMFNYKYKKRDDGFTDQYSRIFMTKMMLIAASITGLSWYSDDIKCLVPGFSGKAVGGFSGKACWINGFYVYDDLRSIKGCFGYFGMPLNTIHNGTLQKDDCTTCIVQRDNQDCQPMKKLFYIQYQWYPFFLAALAMLYYAPYFLFHIANDDIKDLKNEMKKLDPDIDVLVKTYFDPYNQEQMKQQRMKILLNIVMKIAYFIANVVVLLLCDGTLNGDYLSFGTKWIKWAYEPERNNYVDARPYLEAGDTLLPTFGFCDVLEEGLDVKHTILNEHKFVCEISQHILYQYVLMAMWFLIIIGIVISAYGLISLLLSYILWKAANQKDKDKSKLVYKQLTIRQGEYLMFVRQKNMLLYGEVLENLYQRFRDESNKISSHPGFDHENL